MKRRKILHIGGSHSVHVADLVRELDALGYEQCVLSYRKESIVPKNVPVYYYPYDWFYPHKVNTTKSAELNKVIREVLHKESPDIVHAHFIIVSCVPLLILNSVKKLPVVISPWNLRFMHVGGTMEKRIRKVFTICDKVLFGSDDIFDKFNSVYGLCNSRYSFFKLPMDLSAYSDGVVKTDYPVILSARVMQPSNHQDLLLYAIKKMYDAGVKFRSTFLIGQNRHQGQAYFNKMVNLSKQLGVYGACTFINRGLTQTEFIKAIKSSNIVYSVAEDAGFSQTTIQSICSGAVTVVRRNPLEYNLVKENKNAVVTNLDRESVEDCILNAVKNLNGLVVNNRDNDKFQKYDRKRTIPTLCNVYSNMGTCRVCGENSVSIKTINSHDLMCCGECGVKYHRNLPSDAVLNSYYNKLSSRFGSIHKAVAENHLHNKLLFDVYVDEVMSVSEKGASVLEIGCYDGELLRRLRNVGYKCTGIEVNRELSALAKLSGVDIINANIGNIKTSKKFDIVVSNAVLEHMRDPFLFMRSVSTLLRDGGSLIVSVPDSDTNFSVSYPAHLWHFTVKSMDTFMDKCGFIGKSVKRKSSKSIVHISKRSTK